MRVEQLVTKQVHICRPEGSLERAAQLMWDYDCGSLPVISGDGASKAVGSVMRDAQVRRLPVVGSDGRVVGMISLADLAHEAARECAPGASKEITETQVGDTLAACEAPTRWLAAA